MASEALSGATRTKIANRVATSPCLFIRYSVLARKLLHWTGHTQALTFNRMFIGRRVTIFIGSAIIRASASSEVSRYDKYFLVKDNEAALAKPSPNFSIVAVWTINLIISALRLRTTTHRERRASRKPDIPTIFWCRLRSTTRETTSQLPGLQNTCLRRLKKVSHYAIPAQNIPQHKKGWW